MLLITLLLMINGCGQKEKEVGQHETIIIASEAQPFYDSFIRRLTESGWKFSITHIEVYITRGFENEDLYGYCFKASSGMKKDIPIVYLNELKWADPAFTVAEREQLVFHELGHCILNLPHDSMIENGRPVSLMNPVHTSVAPFYQTNYSDYITNLFKYPPGQSFSFDPSQYPSNSSGAYSLFAEEASIQNP